MTQTLSEINVETSPLEEDLLNSKKVLVDPKFVIPASGVEAIPLATLAVQSGVCATVRKRPKTESELQSIARGRELKKPRLDFGEYC